MHTRPNELLTPAQRIAWAIDASGKSLVAIGDEIGCTHVAIHKWANGKTEAGHIKAELLQAFADATGVELRWLLYGSGPVRSAYVRDQSPLIVLAREMVEAGGAYAEQAERVLRALGTAGHA